MKEVGQIEHSRNMKTDALNHLSWFLPTARQRCRAVCLCHVFHETCLSRGRRSDKKPNLASAPGCPGVRSGHVELWHCLQQCLGGIMFLPFPPCPPQGMDAPPSREGQQSHVLPPPLGRASSRAASQAGPCIQEAQTDL